jgi:hypothetical protein
MGVFGSLQVSFVAAFRHRLITFRADRLPRAIRTATVRKFDFDDHSRHLKRSFQSAGLLARCPGAIESPLREDRRVADVIPVVLC